MLNRWIEEGLLDVLADALVSHVDTDALLELARR